MTVEAAAKAARAPLKAAEKENQRASVAVVDRNGDTLVSLRDDGAGPPLPYRRYCWVRDRPRLMTRRWIWLVPSKIWVILASRM
ncbi:heme-binding protein [Streptomyces sp. NPDC091278]|uniref:heme-binding protein n=1 Tax=Streptomyces sp. NPDC091278 TaxID=3155301 RepID=UPI00344BC668